MPLDRVKIGRRWRLTPLSHRSQHKISEHERGWLNLVRCADSFYIHYVCRNFRRAEIIGLWIKLKNTKSGITQLACFIGGLAFCMAKCWGIIPAVLAAASYPNTRIYMIYNVPAAYAA